MSSFCVSRLILLLWSTHVQGSKGFAIVRRDLLRVLPKNRAKTRRTKHSAQLHVGDATAASADNTEETTVDSLSEYLSRRISSAEDPESVRLSLLRTRLDDEQLKGLSDRVSVGPSTLAGAGLGIFATEFCTKGKLLTCYPGDAVINISSPSDLSIASWGDHISNQQMTSMKELDDILFSYMLAVDEDYGILGLPEFDKDNTNSAYLGHFANDGGAILGGDGGDSIIKAYEVQSNSKCNAKHTPIGGGSHMATIARRDIQAGEEIFVSYGPEYWMETQRFAEKRVVERIGLVIGVSFLFVGIILSLLVDQI